QPDGRLIVETFDAKTEVLAAKLTGDYRPSSRDGTGKLVLDLPDLARFSTIAGVVLNGRSHLELSSRARNDNLRLDWQGTLDELGLDGMPEGLAGPLLRLSGGAELQRDQ